MSVDFWDNLDQMVAESRIAIDRPKGSEHPVHEGVIYPLDYGVLEGTMSADGGGIDIWVGSGGSGHADGVVCTVDLWNRDADIKILHSCTDEDMQMILDFLNQFDAMGGVLVKRETENGG